MKILQSKELKIANLSQSKQIQIQNLKAFDKLELIE